MAKDVSFSEYALKLCTILSDYDWTNVQRLGEDLEKIRGTEKQLFLCGNGGSAANAIHLANDYLFGIAKDGGSPLRVTALPANQSVMTCLANDISYDEVFSIQLDAFASEGDILIALSGSGNSPNIVNAIKKAKEKGVKSYAILGYSGGQCLNLADVPIHFPIEDMQISEDLQIMVGHMIMQKLAGAAVPTTSDASEKPSPASLARARWERWAGTAYQASR